MKFKSQSWTHSAFKISKKLFCTRKFKQISDPVFLRVDCRWEIVISELWYACHPKLSLTFLKSCIYFDLFQNKTDNHHAIIFFPFNLPHHSRITSFLLTREHNVPLKLFFFAPLSVGKASHTLQDFTFHNLGKNYGWKAFIHSGGFRMPSTERKKLSS